RTAAVVLAGGGFRATAARSDVVPRAEGTAGATQDDGVDIVVVVGFPESGVEFLLQLKGEGVQLLGPVEGDTRTAALDVVQDVFEIHGLSSRAPILAPRGVGSA